MTRIWICPRCEKRMVSTADIPISARIVCGCAPGAYMTEITGNVRVLPASGIELRFTGTDGSVWL